MMGCMDCMVEDGYTCTGDINDLSICILTGTCGNGVVEGQE